MLLFLNNFKGDENNVEKNCGDSAYTRDGLIKPSRKQRVRRQQLPKGAFFMP